MQIDPYKILGVPPNASLLDIKYAYRELVKKHHPDHGGDEQKILSINAAWEVLGDIEKRQAYDIEKKVDDSFSKGKLSREIKDYEIDNFSKSVKGKVAEEENEMYQWLKTIYMPIDKLLGQIINSFPSQLNELSADPYDDLLMESFCEYLEKSEHKITKINKLYQEFSAPITAKELSLNLYYCFSQVQDGLNELKLYTNGYVDNYLHDGTEMLREARKKRKELHLKRKHLTIR